MNTTCRKVCPSQHLRCWFPCVGCVTRTTLGGLPGGGPEVPGPGGRCARPGRCRPDVGTCARSRFLQFFRVDSIGHSSGPFSSAGTLCRRPDYDSSAGIERVGSGLSRPGAALVAVAGCGPMRLGVARCGPVGPGRPARGGSGMAVGSRRPVARPVLACVCPCVFVRRVVAGRVVPQGFCLAEVRVAGGSADGWINGGTTRDRRRRPRSATGGRRAVPPPGSGPRPADGPDPG